MSKTFARRNLAVAVALSVAAMAATPLVMGASRALATSEAPTAALRVDTIEVAPVAAPMAMTKAEATGAPCLRKVRVVYGGYGTPEGCAAR